MAEQHPLVGLIVNWPSGESWSSGRGKVIAALPDDDQILVEYIPRPGESDPPPPHMLVIPTYMEPGLVVFDTVAAEQAWFEWVMAAGEDERRVVSLVPKKPPPKK